MIQPVKPSFLPFTMMSLCPGTNESGLKNSAAAVKGFGDTDYIWTANILKALLLTGETTADPLKALYLERPSRVSQSALAREPPGEWSSAGLLTAPSLGVQRWWSGWPVRKAVDPDCQSRAILSSRKAVFLFSSPHRSLC